MVSPDARGTPPGTVRHSTEECAGGVGGTRVHRTGDDILCSHFWVQDIQRCACTALHRKYSALYCTHCTVLQCISLRELARCMRGVTCSQQRVSDRPQHLRSSLTAPTCLRPLLRVPHRSNSAWGVPIILLGLRLDSYVTRWAILHRCTVRVQGAGRILGARGVADIS